MIDAEGNDIGELIRLLDDAGYIDCLEYTWVTDEMPTQLPSPSQARAFPRPYGLPIIGPSVRSFGKSRSAFEIDSQARDAPASMAAHSDGSCACECTMTAA